MRLDLDHVRTIARALHTDEKGEQTLNIDIDAMCAAVERLSLWEAGLLSSAIARSAVAKKLTIEQRVILALFAHREAGAP